MRSILHMEMNSTLDTGHAPRLTIKLHLNHSEMHCNLLLRQLLVFLVFLFLLILLFLLLFWRQMNANARHRAMDTGTVGQFL